MTEQAPVDFIDSSYNTNLAPEVMGILDISADTSVDGLESVVAKAKAMVNQQADIIDVGVRATRADQAVAPDSQLELVIPVIERLAGSCRIAIDTGQAEVARGAVAAGASIINDETASLGLVAAELGVGWIAMHVQGGPADRERPFYQDPVVEIREYLVERAAAAAEAGVEDIWIDPGFGFGKTLGNDLDLLANIDSFVETKWPVAIGTSRKRMVGDLIARSDGADHRTPPTDRLVGSVVTATYAMLAGVALIRVHDVKAAKQAATVVAGER